MSELPGWEQVAPGFWVPVKPKTVVAPALATEKPEPKTREQMATTLAQAGIHVDTSFPTAAEIAAERERKQKEHEDLLEDHEKQRQAREQLEAKSDCESMLAVINGRIDQEFMTLLRGVVATNKETGEIDYIATKAKRNECLDAHARAVADGVRFKIR